MSRVACLLLLVLSACITPPARVAIDASSKEGLILIEIDPVSGVVETKDGLLKIISMNYFLTFSRFAAEEGLQTSVLGEWIHVDFLNPKDTVTRFYAAPAPAGTYAFEALNVGYGVSWGACFNKSTIAFDVPAGQVVYLGKFSPKAIFDDISTNLPPSLPVGTYQYLYDRSAPSLELPESVEQKTLEIEDFLRRVYPNVRAPVAIGKTRSVSFSSGPSSLLSRFPRCAKTK
jgi:hypothetical protein